MAEHVLEPVRILQHLRNGERSIDLNRREIVPASLAAALRMGCNNDIDVRNCPAEPWMPRAVATALQLKVA